MSMFFFLGTEDAFPSVEWAEFLPVRTRLDPDEYPGAVYELEVMGYTNNASFPLYSRLYNVTDGSEVAGSSFLATVATSSSRCRSASFDLPVGAKEYAIHYGGEVGGEFTLHSAVLRVVPA